MPDSLLPLYLLLFLPLKALWRSRYPAPPKPTLPALQSYWRQSRFLLVLLGVFALVAWRGNHSVKELGLAIPPSPGGVWGLVCAGCLLAVLLIVDQWMAFRMTEEDRVKQADKLGELPFPMPRTGVETIAYIAMMLAMTASWELLYRGYLLLVLAPLTGMPLAVALAAVAYGAAHGYKNPWQFAGAIAIALAFTVGYALTGSLWWLIVLHAATPLSMVYVVRRLKAAAPLDGAVSP
ncbi:CPBP family intramembrane glutamic endopeptidase [Rugamonas sp.]|uniref:CPBP family intramembrane glutamic endopeptidase n=1 Tax=Rugamonas sp. TaxID=1926287 RepID=UPI0025FE1774|nr:CPBP family intramembrane glutamic endopeptidase [Rugamonas sp.]